MFDKHVSIEELSHLSAQLEALEGLKDDEDFQPDPYLHPECERNDDNGDELTFDNYRGE